RQRRLARPCTAIQGCWHGCFWRARPSALGSSGGDTIGDWQGTSKRSPSDLTSERIFRLLNQLSELLFQPAEDTRLRHADRRAGQDAERPCGGRATVAIRAENGHEAGRLLAHVLGRDVLSRAAHAAEGTAVVHQRCVQLYQNAAGIVVLGPETLQQR